VRVHGDTPLHRVEVRDSPFVEAGINADLYNRNGGAECLRARV
jgi:hypothetical protein